MLPPLLCPSGASFLFLCSFLALTFSGCTFERRDTEPAEGLGSADGARATEGELSAGEAEDIARAAVDAFRESVAAGDLSLALARLHGEATLVDPLVGQAAETVSRGELLLELRRRHAEGLVYEPLEADVFLAGEDAALVVSLLSMLREGDAEIPEEVGRVLETVYLVGSDEGWKIRHLHRSLSPSQ